MLIGVNDLSERDKSELDKSLEAVADTAHKSVTLFEKLCNLLLNSGVAEKCRYKLARSVRLVTAGEAAGDKDDLRLLHLLGKLVNASCNTVGCKVVDNKYLSLCPCVGRRLSGVILAVCAGEYGNKNMRLGSFNSRSLIFFLGK